NSVGAQDAAKVDEVSKSPEVEQKRSMSKFSPTAPDVENFVAGAGVSPSSRALGKCGPSGAGNTLSNVGNPVERKSDSVPGERRVKMSKIRQVIAARLKESQNVAATLSTFNEVDMSAVMAIRAKYKDSFIKKHDVKLGFMSFFIRAVVLACAEIPVLNAEIRGDEIIYRDYCNIGVAVGTDKGLVVPVIRAAESMSLAELEQKLVELSTLARGGKLAVSDMSGATFTITNGGVYGSLLSTPIINPPQSGILGMHAIQERPVVVEGKIEIRPMMYIALSYDHRIVDGQGAVTFLVRVKQYIEDPTRMTLMV
ncbi:dihydrolipoyllysine-residue succinyltransferase, partial [Anaplasma bovis]|uniref:dihydrolipoyllysine-residue succinyltransferase n=1 Tax=Anaplasma bovis TaxID=186733 RepID=UPI002FEEDB40